MTPHEFGVVDSSEWLIVGGRILGVYLVARLIAEAEVPQDRLAIVDPAETLEHRADIGSVIGFLTSGH
ncbi:MAG: hypothetical protein GWP39_08735 [Planctomycetia bacterium]|nr:hypothetical protein [Planctomycetia bacterium]NCG12227.1 hypothetical protein [Planctomycetia bacterium]NCG56184.1 hypothetical protein [Pseudomonadota bacterium]